MKFISIILASLSISSCFACDLCYLELDNALKYSELEFQRIYARYLLNNATVKDVNECLDREKGLLQAMEIILVNHPEYKIYFNQTPPG